MRQNLCITMDNNNLILFFQNILVLEREMIFNQIKCFTYGSIHVKKNLTRLFKDQTRTRDYS